MNVLAFGIGNLGGPDLFVMLLIVLVLFGSKKLPDLARGLGQSINEFKKAREDIDREVHNAGVQPFQSKPTETAITEADLISPTRKTSTAKCARSAESVPGETAMEPPAEGACSTSSTATS
jgi:sec-independent protein translocase protein TatA